MPVSNIEGFLELGHLSDIQIHPLKSMALVPGVGSSEDGLLIGMLEAGSNWQLSPITLPDDQGGEETQGYMLETTAIFPFSLYSDVERVVKYYQKNPIDISHLVFSVANHGDLIRSFYLKGFDFNNPFNSTSAIREIQIRPPFSFTLNIEPVDMRNRQKLVIKKFFEYEDEYSEYL